MRCLPLLFITIIISGCLNEEFQFSAEAQRLGSLSMGEISQEFERLGRLPGAPGPMPVGPAEVKAGMIALQNIDGLSATQQELAHALVWAGKDFYRNEDILCDTSWENSTFWLENRFLGPLKLVENLEGGGAGRVYLDYHSWNNDGLPVIAVDYSVTTPSMGFMRNEMRLSDKDNGVAGTRTYLGMMWIKAGAASIPFAYFIPDQVDVFECPY